jgi:CDP-diacylglycerol--glycerol-3-phosphate 3-phosphatidyltransferase
LTAPGAFTIVRALNLPNALTLLRIFLVPLLVVVLLTRAEGHVYVGAGIFGLAVLTDYLDGYFARRRNEVTRLGILLDPLADKLLTAAAFLSLVEMGLVPAWVVMIILARELAVTGLRNVAAGRGVLIRASGLGKAKMVAQVTAILLLLLSRAMPALHPPGLVALAVVVVLTLVSGADYFLRFWRDVLRGPSRSASAGAEPPATSADGSSRTRKTQEGLADRPGPREASIPSGVSAARRGPRP